MSIPAILYGIGFLLAGAESVPGITLSRISGYRRSHRGVTTHHLFALSRTLRIRQAYGLGFSTVNSTSPPSAFVDYARLGLIFMLFRGLHGPKGTGMGVEKLAFHLKWPKFGG